MVEAVIQGSRPTSSVSQRLICNTCISNAGYALDRKVGFVESRGDGDHEALKRRDICSRILLI